MTLDEFMQARGFNDVTFAEKLHKDRATVSRYRRGIKVPSAQTIKRIVELSEGQVTANDLLGIQLKVVCR